MVVLVGGGYYFSSQLLDNSPAVPDWDTQVLEVDPADGVAPRTVTLEPTEETLRDGVFGLDTSAGYAIMGRILASDDDGVTRPVRRVQGELDPNTLVEPLATVHNGNPLQALDVPFQAIDYESELGPMAAWHTPGRGDTWAIMVHGYKSNRRGLLRDYGVVRDFRLPILNVTYRNDPGNPPAPDGLIQLGKEEWRDVQSAMDWAIDQGAERFVVFGDSMGGAIVSNLYRLGDYRDRIDALVLDAPALDWDAVLQLQASERGLPGIVADSAERWVSARIGFDFTAYDQIDQAGDFDVPILLFHGTADDVVPFETSQEFADALPDLVTFYPAEGAGHVQAWNIDPALYESRLTRFLRENAAATTERSGQPRN